MRWHQEKTLMLLIFLGINLALAYLNFWRPYQVLAERTGSEALQQLAVADIEALGLLVTANIPVNPERGAPLRLQMSSAAAAAHGLVERLFTTSSEPAELQQQAIISLCGLEHWRYSLPEQSLYITPRGHWTLRLSAPAGTVPSDTPQAQRLERVAEELARSYNLQPSVAAATGQSWLQAHQGRPVFDAGLLLSRDHQGTTLDYSLVQIVGEVGRREWVSSPIDILLLMGRDPLLRELADSARERGEQLLLADLTLGYFAQFAAAAAGANQEIIARPTWRVLISGAGTLYYDALTGRRLFPTP